MSSQTNILELLASKICHDLISPVGAIGNGVEFLQEMGPEAGEEATGLIAYSARQASAKLKAFRMAYAAGGADAGIKLEEVHETFNDVLDENKVKLQWDPHTSLGPAERPPGFCKLLMCALLQAADCLPKGGTIAVKSGDGGSALITATGENAAPKEKVADALKLQIPEEQLGPKNIHAYVTAQMAGKYGFELTLKAAANTVTLQLSPQ